MIPVLKLMISELFASSVYNGILVFGHAMLEHISVFDISVHNGMYLKTKSTSATSSSKSIPVEVDHSGRNSSPSATFS